MSEDLDSNIAALEQILISKKGKPAEVEGDIDDQISALETMVAAKKEPGVLENLGNGALNAVSALGKTVDSYTGAPTRAALASVVQGNYADAPGKFADQFGADPSTAPTGKEIAQVAGFSAENGNVKKSPMMIEDEKRAFNKKEVSPNMETYSPAGMAGVGIDVLADPLNFIPVGAIAKGVTKATGAITKGAAKYALKGTVAAADAVVGAERATNAAKATGQYIDRVVDSVKNSWNPSRAEDFSHYADIAQKNGIDPKLLPETVEFGPNSTITKKSKVAAEAPGGENIQKRYVQAQAQVEGALDSQIGKYTGGQSLSKDDAGNLLRDGYNKGIKSFFDQDMLTHKKVIASNPGMVLNQDALSSVKGKINSLKRDAIGRTRRGIGSQRDEANSFLKDVDVLERSMDKNGNLSYKRASEMLTNIGEEAFKKYMPGTKIPTDQKKLQELYFSLRDSMYESSAHVLGPEAATELAMNNQIISDFLKEKGRVSKIFEGDMSPDKIFHRIADSADTDQLRAVKEILSPEDFQKFKGAYLENTIRRSTDGSRSPLYKSTIKELEKKKAGLSVLFQPEEVKDFADVLQLGDRVGDHIFNTSKTNTAAQFSPKEFLGNLLTSGTDELTLEMLKKRAREGKAAPGGALVPSAVIPAGSPVKPAPATRFAARQLPLIGSKGKQASEFGRVGSVQETNKEIERRKRSTAGGRNGNR